ncbi:MAG: hypothetical protein JSS03_00665 [Proteobacteria bacterium]|nr:hypothetical protein [Pseudomonadota bacterium]
MTIRADTAVEPHTFTVFAANGDRPPADREPARAAVEDLPYAEEPPLRPWSVRKRTPIPARERWSAIAITLAVHALLFLSLRAAMTPVPIHHTARRDVLQIVYLISAPAPTPPRTQPKTPLAAHAPAPSAVAIARRAVPSGHTSANATHAIRPVPAAPVAAPPPAAESPTTTLTLFNPDGSVHLPPGQITQSAHDPLGRTHRTADRFLPDPPLGKAPTYEFHDVTGRDRIATAFHCVQNPLTCLKPHRDVNGHLRVSINTVHDDGYDPCPELEQHLANLDPNDTAARESDMQWLIQSCGDR